MSGNVVLSERPTLAAARPESICLFQERVHDKLDEEYAKSQRREKTKTTALCSERPDNETQGFFSKLKQRLSEKCVETS